MIPRAHSRHHIVYTIALIGFIYTLHSVLPMYSNSSFLNVFADENTVGYIYMFGAAISVLGFLVAPGLIRRYGGPELAHELEQTGYAEFAEGQAA